MNKKTRVSFAIAILALFVAMIGTAVMGCNPAAGSALREIGTKIDPAALLACARVEGEFADKARCLGATVVTQGLRTAYDFALDQTQQALAHGAPTGAGEPEISRDEALRRMDNAIELLNYQIAIAQE